MFDLAGAIDMHVHAGPDLFERVVDDLELAAAYAAAGMAGMVVKAHLESTASRAYHTNQRLAEQGFSFRYVGGICLNYPVGGINPAAVDACLRAGGRVVWMPSGHSRFHAQVKGTLGNWGVGDMRLYNPIGAQGISVLDEQGQLTQDAREVIALVREHRAVLATSHLSPTEILALADACREPKVKLVVTHLRWTPEYDLALGQEAVARGAVVEVAASTVGGYEHRCTLEEAADIIRTLGPANMVLSSDAGSPRYPSPPELMRSLGENLLARNISRADLHQMMQANPQELLAA